MTEIPGFDAIAMLFPYLAETGSVRVRVAVAFLPEQSAPGAGRWFWSYHIRIENSGDRPVQLMSRHWHIVDGRGGEHEVRGEGVVGEMPMIPAGGSFDYVSGCPLDTPSGSMRGSYRLIDPEGNAFDAAIPAFPLLSPV